MVRSGNQTASTRHWNTRAVSGVGFLEECQKTMNGEKYISALNRKMLPGALMFFPEMHMQWWFQDHNPPCHWAKNVKDWIQERNVDIIEWPKSEPYGESLADNWSKSLCNETKYQSWADCKDQGNLGHDIEWAELETGYHHAWLMPSGHQQQWMAYQVLDHHNQPYGPF